MKRLLIAVLLVLGVSNADADSISQFLMGDGLIALMKDCDNYHAGQTTDGNYYSCGASIAYVVGVIDAYQTAHSWADTESDICINVPITRGGLADEVRKYLDDNPADLYMGAASQVLSALQEAFPCESSKKPQQGPR